MIYLIPNQANQSVYVTLREASYEFTTEADSYLLHLHKVDGGADYYLIPVVLNNNERYTQLRIGTNTNNAVNGSLLITESGEYSYTIYGQTGTSNLDPENAAVIGVYEIGTCWIADDYTGYYFTDNTSIPNTFIDGQ